MFAMISLPIEVTSVAITFAVREFAQYGRDVKWTDFKIKFDDLVRTFVPGEALDDVCVRVANTVIDAIQVGCTDAVDMEAILVACAAKDWVAARVAVGALVTKVAGPELGQLLSAA